MKVSDNVYLVECPFLRPGYFVSSCIIAGRGIVLVDTGLEDSPKQAIYPYLGDLGLGIRDVSHIILTHAHFDHCGGVSRIREEVLCRVGVHEYGKPFLEDPLLLDIQLNRRFPILYGIGEPRFKPVEADIVFKDSDIIDTGSVRLRIIHTPGHSPCSSCIVYEDKGIYISGDSIQGYGGNRPLLFHSSIDYMESLDKFSKEHIDILVLGHPFPPYGRAILRSWEVRDFIKESLEAIEKLRSLVLDILRESGKPMNPREIYERIGVSQPITIGCILEDLEREGEASRFDEGVDLWVG
ncbi:MAG: MBL fold metallo-hydrolase [Candidatus Bathyarchaeia archaeon]|nr:MBL fold metallo-hydrolase [Candidatus Bathyarchaeota archaeon]